MVGNDGYWLENLAVLHYSTRYSFCRNCRIACLHTCDLASRAVSKRVGDVHQVSTGNVAAPVIPVGVLPLG